MLNHLLADPWNDQAAVSGDSSDVEVVGGGDGDLAVDDREEQGSSRT